MVLQGPCQEGGLGVGAERRFGQARAGEVALQGLGDAQDGAVVGELGCETVTASFVARGGNFRRP